ncbi:hypothetical protein Salat_0535000 [Sesamum alatum]|uniref:Uncharacterized protein n=1 Tax=Sesamum alatum TaxID=300844 RepID=A0AAE1YQ41_9LAMI|nr:hypothetical protein Salat_0535000 [Sesamum alatum]
MKFTFEGAKRRREEGSTISSKMVQKEINYVGFEKLVNLDAYHDPIHAPAERSDSGLGEFKRRLEENDNVDADYTNALLYILNKEERVNLHKKQREEDDVLENNVDYSSEEEENDPQYELFLKCLKEDGKSYALEVRKSCLPVVIKYEGDTSSDEECDPEPRRKLRSAMKQNNGPSSQHGVQNRYKDDSPSTSTEEVKNLNRRKSRKKAESEKVESVKPSTNDIVPDPDYLIFHQNSKAVDDHYVYTYGGHTIVFEKTYGENNREQEKHDGEPSSDVEILDSIYTLSSPTMASEFRHQVITVLRKPYDEEEHDKLWLDIGLRKPEERHLDLRHGRERSYGKRKDGKSYLDHHPDLEMQLLQFQDDKPKCLNLLRGFFFWLQNFLQNGSFKPWQDAECLAINPESC